jgi:hypothetical protein
MPLKYRVLIIFLTFLIVGIIDYKKNPRNPGRAKEYLFLFSMVIIAMLYGIIHDFITYYISPDYFVLGKGIESAKDGFNIDVVKLAMMALWWVGLLIAVIFLIANNSRKHTPQLRYPTLYRLTIYPLSISIVFAVLIGSFFYLYGLRFNDWLPELASMTAQRRFMTTWGVHIGSYLGGLVGLVVAVIRIVALRKRQFKLKT